MGCMYSAQYASSMERSSVAAPLACMYTGTKMLTAMYPPDEPTASTEERQAESTSASEVMVMVKKSCPGSVTRM